MPPRPVDDNNYLSISNFLRGMDTSTSEWAQDQPGHDLIQNMLIHGGELTPIWGRDSRTPAIQTETPLDAVYDWTYRYSEGYPEWTVRIAIEGGIIYVENKLADGTCIYKPMYNAVDDPESGYVAGTVWDGSITQHANSLFITGLGKKVMEGSTLYNAAPIVWTGYCDVNRTATVLTASKSKVTLSAVTYSDQNARGDCITLTDGEKVETRKIVDIDGDDVYVNAAFDQAYAAGTTCVTARINHVGIPTPYVGTSLTASTIECALEAGVALEIGEYKYRFVLLNTERSISSNYGLTVAITTTGGNQKVIVGTVGVKPIPEEFNGTNGEKWGLYQADKLQIWRTLVGGDVYYLLTTLTRDQGTSPNTYKFQDHYHDTTTDTALAATGATVWSEQLNEGHDQPPALAWTVSYNDRLWGPELKNMAKMRVSQSVSGEYWDEIDASLVDELSLISTQGTGWTLGTRGAPIVAAVPEMGAYTTAGGWVGSSLLVLTRGGAKRIFGYDLSDFRAEVAHAVECIARKTAVRYGAYVMWMSRMGVMAMPAGGNQPVCISRQIENVLLGYRNFQADDAWIDSAAVAWNDYYILTAPSGTGELNAFCCYLGETGPNGIKFGWTQCKDTLVSSWYHVSEKDNRADAYGGYGDLIYCDANINGSVWRVCPWQQAPNKTPLPLAYRSGICTLSSDAKTAFYRRRIRQLVCIIATDADQDITFTLKIWRLGLNADASDSPERDPELSMTQTLACDVATYHGAPRLLIFNPPVPVECRWFKFELSTTTNADFRIRLIRLAWKTMEDQWGGEAI